MTRRKVKASVLRERMLQRRGLIQETGPSRPGAPRFRAKAASVPNAKLKTPQMLLKEIEYDMDIEDILSSGPLHHNDIAIANCRRCVQCRYGIKYPTASRWRKKLGIAHWDGPRDVA